MPFPETIFVNEDDNLVTMSLLDMKTGDDIGKNLRPALPDSYYDKEHLILGNPDAKDKLVVFSDPQCPFCKSFMPKLIKDVEANPDKLAVYYYHMPLTRIHPASETIVRVMEHLQKQGKKDEALKLYNLKINPRERNEKKILDAINKQFNLNITQKDINTPEVKKAIADDMNKAGRMMVKGTPTVFFNGEFDRSRLEYKKALK
jgi:protein-disulfide isomerase